MKKKTNNQDELELDNISNDEDSRFEASYHSEIWYS